MKRIRILRDICLLLAAFVMVQIIVISVYALDDIVDNGVDLPVPETTIAETTVAETTVSAETVPPAATLPAETAPVTEPVPTEPSVPQTLPPETLPPETLPAETVPEETEPPMRMSRYSIDALPLYFQTDYPDTMYGSGTIYTSGCGITSLAMVATYMTDHIYYPDELADYFGGCAQNNIDRLEYACDALQLPYEGRLNFHETLQGLKDGGVAIVLMGGKSLFTETQHFIVLTGFTEDGKIMVLDPYQPNYTHWQLKNGLVHGFETNDLLLGYEGGWVFHKSQMPEEPYIYVPEVYEGEKRYDFSLTEEETNLLARMVWVESQGEPFEGQQAVAEVVLNRLAAGNFQDNLRSIILADGQFRSTSKLKDAKPNQTQYDAIERALNGPYVLPEDVVFFATFAVNENVWGKIGGHTFCYQWDSAENQE